MIIDPHSNTEIIGAHIMNLILQLRKLRYREPKCSVQMTKPIQWQNWECWSPVLDLSLPSLISIYYESKAECLLQQYIYWKQNRVQNQNSTHIKSRKVKTSIKMTWGSCFCQGSPKLWKQNLKATDRGFQVFHLFYSWRGKSRDSFFFYGQLRLWPIEKSSDKIINHQFSVSKNDLCKVILKGAITAKKQTNK